MTEVRQEHREVAAKIVDGWPLFTRPGDQKSMVHDIATALSAAEEAAVARERAECAELLSNRADELQVDGWVGLAAAAHIDRLAAAIRARRP